MKRKAYTWLMLGVIVTGLLANGGLGTSAAQAQNTIALAPATVGVAQTATVDGIITCATGSCSGFSVTIQYDPAMLRVDSAVVGPYLGTQVFEAANLIDQASGTVTLAAAALGALPSGASNVLFQLTVTGMAEGTTTLSFSAVSLADASGAAVPASGVNGTVTVLETGIIPPFTPPDAAWELAFTAERDGNPEIYAMNANGNNVRRLTDNPALDTHADWSPGGDQIAFVSERDGNREIYVMNADGSNQRRLTDNPAMDDEPAWSRDGTQIVFVSDRDGDPELYIMAADGSNVRRLTTSPGADASPAWQRYKDQIGFISAREGTPEVFVMNDDGSATQRLSSLFGANGWYPAWSPNGQLLSFMIERGGAADMYVMNADGSSPTQLGDPNDRISITDWSPDGAWIAYASARDGDADLYVIGVTTGQVFRLNDSPAADTAPDWRPLQAAPCLVRTDRRDVSVHVGPGYNRGQFAYMPVNRNILVIGQALADDGVLWWELDKREFEGHEMVNSLWVSSEDVEEIGACGAVPPSDVPPIIPGDTPRPTPPGNWGDCGSCDTCGHPASECVLAPTGECLWDPNTCGPPPDDGGRCFSISLTYTPSDGGWGTAAVVTPPNCERSTYLPGTPVTIVASPVGNFNVLAWTGSCTGLASPATFVTSQTVTMTSNCSVNVQFGRYN